MRIVFHCKKEKRKKKNAPHPALQIKYVSGGERKNNNIKFLITLKVFTTCICTQTMQFIFLEAFSYILKSLRFSQMKFLFYML